MNKNAKTVASKPQGKLTADLKELIARIWRENPISCSSNIQMLVESACGKRFSVNTILKYRPKDLPKVVGIKGKKGVVGTLGALGHETTMKVAPKTKDPTPDQIKVRAEAIRAERYKKMGGTKDQGAF